MLRLRPHQLCHNGRSPRRQRPGALVAICLAAMTLMLSACIKNEFRMVFSLPQTVNSTYRLSYYASDARGGLHIETAVAVAAGKADVKGITRYPTLVTINHGISQLPAAIFYAERGDKIEVSGDDADPVGWKISGNKITDQLTSWRIENKKVIEDAIRAGRGDSDSAPGKRLNAVVAKFVKGNPDSPAAPLLLLSYFDASLQPEEFRSLISMIEDKESFKKYADLLARQDLNSATAVIPDYRKMKLRDLVVQSAGHNIDTLRFASGAKPILLYYWRKNDPRHEEIADTLKRIVKWRPDSASMIIADVGLTPDSAQWRSTIRLDSLQHTVRAFSPRGLADPDAIRLGVRSTPWFIVGSGKGKTAYAGPDMAEAIRVFRSLRPKTKPDSPKP